jgi:probable phosphoglycerate mutase
VAIAGPSSVLLVRHGETEWSARGCHTGRTDVPMTDAGRAQAARAGEMLATLLRSRPGALVFTSPLRRASETAAIALPDMPAEETHLLVELDYGDYEGVTVEDIHARVPDWNLFIDSAPGGESIAAATARCESFIAKLERMAAGRPVVAFTHGHFSRLLTMRLLGLPGVAAASFYNDTASIALLDHRRDRLVLTGWNIGGAR